MGVESEGVQHLLFPSYSLFPQMPDLRVATVPFQFLPGIPAQNDGKVMEGLGEILQASGRVKGVSNGRPFNLLLGPDVPHNGPARMNANAHFHGLASQYKLLA